MCRVQAEEKSEARKGEAGRAVQEVEGAQEKMFCQLQRLQRGGA
jgi:hypothetical protein